MEDFVLVLILALIIGAAILYIRREKKKGAVCVGCPHAGECAKKRKGVPCEGNPDSSSAKR